LSYAFAGFDHGLFLALDDIPVCFHWGWCIGSTARRQAQNGSGRALLLKRTKIGYKLHGGNELHSKDSIAGGRFGTGFSSKACPWADFTVGIKVGVFGGDDPGFWGKKDVAWTRDMAVGCRIMRKW